MQFNDSDGNMNETGDELTNNATELGKEGLKFAGNTIKNTPKNIKRGVNATKTTVQNTKKAIQLAAKAAKAMAQVFTKLVAFLVAHIVPLLIVVAVILIFLIVFNTINNRKNTTADKETKKVINGVSVDADWDEKIKTSYYAMFANYSYYYTIDDKNTLCQGNINMNEDGDINAKSCEDDVHDKYNREGSFTLSTSLLKYLDETLNGTNRYPKQFIKPLYNTCSTGEEKNGMCKKKDLVGPDGSNDGDDMVQSQKFTEIENCNEDKCDGKYLLNKTEEDAGIWDWGLAPILHYKKYEEEEYIKNYRVKEITYWDKEKEEYKTCQKSKCPEDLLKKVEDQENDKIKQEKLYRKVYTNYLIDSVATFMGDASNEIEQVEEATGKQISENGLIADRDSVPQFYKSYTTLKNVTASNKDKKYYEDTEIMKVVEITVTTSNSTSSSTTAGGTTTNPTFENPFEDSGTLSYNNKSKKETKSKNKTTTPEIKLEPKVNTEVVSSQSCNGKLTIKNNAFYCDGAKLTKKPSDSTGKVYRYQVSKQAEKPIRYIMVGDEWKKEYKYRNNVPDIDNLDEGQYLKDYITHYRAYAKDDEIERFGNVEAMKSIIKNNENDENDEKIYHASQFKDTLIALYGQDVFDAKEANCKGKSCSDSDSDDTESLSGFSSGGKGIERNTDSVNIMNAKFKALPSDEQKVFKECAEKYGIDINLLKAMAMQEHGFQHSYANGAYGTMQIEHVHLGGTAVATTISGQPVSIPITEETLLDPYKNIEIGTIFLRNHIDEWKGNVLLALQAYNFGPGGLKKVLNAYIKANNGINSIDDIIKNPNDLGWTSKQYMKVYQCGTPLHQCGDPNYLANVLKYSASQTLTFAGAYYQGTVSLNVDSLTVGTTDTSSNLSLSDKINWAANKSIIYNNWNLLYETDRNVLKVTIDKTKNKYMAKEDGYYNKIGYKAKRSKLSIDKIIATYFAQETNTNIEDNMKITKEMWRERFTDMFSSYGSEKLKLQKYKWEEYFTEMPGTPITENFKAVEHFGYPEDSTYVTGDNHLAHGGKYKRYMTMKASVGTKVHTIVSGTVTEIGDNYVTLSHEPGSKDKDVETTYEGIIPDKDLKIDEEVDALDDLGEMDGEELNVYLMVGNVYTDPEWVLEIAKNMKKYNLTGSLLADSIGVTNAESEKIIKYLQANADKLQKEFEKDAEAGKFFDDNHGVQVEDSWKAGSPLLISSIAWTRQNPKYANTNHEGIDVSTTGTVTTFQKGILVSYVDGFPNTGVGGGGCAYNQFNNNLANTAIVLYMSNQKTWYSVIYGHLLTGSTTPLKRKVSDPVMKKYEEIAITGNSGCSTGSHTHIQLHQLNGMKLKQIADFYSKNRGSWSEKTWGLGDQYNPANHCENNRSRQCFYKPDVFFNVHVLDNRTGRAS